MYRDIQSGSLYLRSMKPFSFIQFPNAKALKLKVKSRRIFKMSLLCNKVKFGRASVVFYFFLSAG